MHKKLKFEIGIFMELQLDLSKHCIETACRRHYNKVISDYFKAGREEKRQLTDTIEMLFQALETLYFSRLRARYPALAGGTNKNVILALANDDLIIAIDDKKVGC